MRNGYYLLSFIIPMYNAEHYIVRCLDSIFHSDLPIGEYEIVIVNDGSHDKSPSIVQEYLKNHENIIFLSQENQGQSIARNLGIQTANGKYIWCVDSDDALVNNLNFIFDFLKKHPDTDIIKTAIKTFHEGQSMNYNQLDGSYVHKSGREMLLSGYHPSSMCNMIVRKSLIEEQNLQLIPDIVGEDAEFSHKVYAFAKSVYTFNYITYLYLYNANSTTKQQNKQNILREYKSRIIVSQSFSSFAKTISVTDPALSLFFENRSKNILLSLLLTMVRSRRKNHDAGINQIVFKEMKSQGVYPIKGRFDSKKKTFCKWFLNIEFILRCLI